MGKTNGLQMATLSIGGNDAKLEDILAACIFNWDKDIRLDCDKTLDDSQKTIDDDKFAHNLDTALSAVKGAMANADAKIYWTGYAHFWDDSTNDCDKVTWSFLYNLGNRQYLTQARRTKMNQLVDSVNKKIDEAVGRAGGQAIFVPWNAAVDYIEGHFCQPGVDEGKAKNRQETAFYEWGTTKEDDFDKNHGGELRKRQTDVGQVPPGKDIKDTWEGSIAQAVADLIKSGAKPEDIGISPDDAVHAQSGLLLPDKYGRIFHPTMFAHAVIAESIIRLMDDVKAKFICQKGATSTYIGCPIPTGPASHDGEQTSCNGAGTNGENARFKVSDAETAIKTFCLKHQHDNAQSGPQGLLEKYDNGGGSSLVLQASRDTEAACAKFPDLGALDYWSCTDNFHHAINDCKCSLP